MKIIKFLLALGLTFTAIYFLNKPITLTSPSEEDPSKIKENVLPPLGPFLCPFSGFWQNAESLDSYMPVSLNFPELIGPVKIVFDDRLVPHIFAENMTDALFAQGYVTAKFRLWQMDMITRLCSGRLAEVLGEDLVKTDRMQRRRGMVYGAQNALKSWQESPESFELIESYSAGVNAYMQNLAWKDMPLEFKLMNYQPEKWNSLKSALVKKYMDFTLCFGEDDLEASNAMQVLGGAMFSKLYPEYNPDESPVIPNGTKWNFSPTQPAPKKAIEEAVGMLEYRLYPKNREMVGSNNWAVAGSKTLSGKPILCNDPHLQLTFPSIWFEVQIHVPNVNAYGVCVPGIPGIQIGFNEDIAWGETNVGHDVLDWYKISWTDAGRTSYQFDGGVKEATVRIEEIKVRGKEQPILDTVKWTVWGPVTYEKKDSTAWEGMAMHWLANEKSDPQEIMTFIGLMGSKNYEDYSESLVHFDYPAQNFVFASKTGDIALKANGKFPIKKKEQGRFVQDGSQSANAYSGFVPKNQVPQTKNPSRGFVASANQRTTDASYPYYYNSVHFENFRGRYLNRELSRMDSIQPKDMMRLQTSNVSLLAEDALPEMLKQLDTNALSAVQKALVKKMRAWDFSFDKEKVEPVAFEEWWKNVYEMTFDEVLVWKDSIPILMPEKWRLVKFLLETPSDVIFDVQKTPEREVSKSIINAAFQKMTNDFSEKFLDPTFNWAIHKGTSIMHLAKIPAFSKTDLDVGGSRNALNAISETHGPSWRMVVALGDEVKAWGVFPGGQSGNPGSPFYYGGLDKWLKGEYNEIYFMKNAEDIRPTNIFTIDMGKGERK